MSPAAVDFPSPITSSLSKPSAHPQNPSDETPSSNPPFNFNALGSDGPNVPSRSTRPRPRLVKHRKQHARSRTWLADPGPELNPFRSVSAADTSASNQFTFSSGGEGFVFGAKLSGIGEKAELNSGDGGNFNELESVANQNDSGPSSRESGAGKTDANLSTENGESAGYVENLGDSECSSNVGDREYCENEGTESRGIGNEAEGRSYSGVGFVFGSSWGGSSSCFNSLKNHSSGNVENLVDEVGSKMKADSFKFNNEEHSCSNKVHEEGSFAFGSGGKEGSGLTDSKLPNCQGEVKPSDEDLGDCKSKSNSLNDKLSSDFSSKCKLVFESCEVTDADSHKSTNHVVFGSESNTAGTTGATSSSAQFTFQTGLGVQTNGCASKASSADGVKGKDGSNFTSSLDGFGVCFEDFNTPLQFSSCLKETLIPEINKANINVKGRSVRDKRSRKTRAKLKKPSLSKQRPAQDNVPKESSCQGTPDSPGCCSPMDFSPYGETIVVDPHLRESSATSNDSIHLGSNTAPSVSDATVTIGPNGDERELAAKGDNIYGKAIDENSGHYGERIFVNHCSTKGSGSGVKNKKKVGCNRVKNKKKVGYNIFVITPSPNVEFGADKSTPHSSTSLSSDVVEKLEPHEQVTKVHIPSTDATHETCEKWRIRGNKAYRNKDFSKAEDFYTQGIVSVPSSERSGSCLKPLLLCYSNRAATRMYMGKIREALGDCMMATALDPNFLKVQMRAANFHLLLGEVENAQRYFNNCLESRTGVCLDRRTVIDSADGIQKAQKVAEYMNRSAKLLEQKTTDAALSALEIVSEALSISEYSEKLLEMKAEALCLLRRYEEAIQLCEHSMCFAEKNFSSLNSVVNMDGAGCEDHPYARLWRWFFISKSYFHLGRFEAALNLLEKLEQVGSIKNRYASKNLESSISLAATIRELLSHKDAGNDAFRSRKHTEAVEHYTVALSRNIGSRPFSAICLCNRAAAHQALGQITDAIADCSLAIALDGNYAKAVSRRATLHEMIRDYGQAASDLQRLISVLENQYGDKAKEPNSQGSSTGRTQELRNAYRRKPLMEEEAKKGIPFNFYLILGIKPSDSSADIKKAYRKAALKHHPDKAGQFLARSESGDEGRLWKEISLEVHKDADRLFKMIGEAYAVLSDPNKRSEYDFDEDIRKSAKESKDHGTYRKP
ncbi:hypothetical protein ACLB2K_063342 [Fragaria x ananassa]